jgi:dCTP deaminase
MILVDEEIKRALDTGEIEIRNFSDQCLQPASYDLRIGEEGFTLLVGKVIPIQIEGSLEIQPGDFALVMTHERLRLPTNMVGHFGLRSFYARKGLLLTSGPQVDPGFEGKLIVGLVNFSSQSVILHYLEKFCSLELHRLAKHAGTSYQGPYQGQEHITDKVINNIPKERFPLAVMLVRQLVAASPSLRPLERRPSHWVEPPRILASFQREKAAFEQLLPELLKTHRGQYVVVKGEKAVLFGADKTKLAKQAYEKLGYGILYIGLIEEEPEIMHIPTPKIAKKV